MSQIGHLVLKLLALAFGLRFPEIIQLNAAKLMFNIQAGQATPCLKQLFSRNVNNTRLGQLEHTLKLLTIKTNIGRRRISFPLFFLLLPFAHTLTHTSALLSH
jgi:hypothetical protein